MTTKQQRRRQNFGRTRNRRDEVVIGDTVRSTAHRSRFGAEHRPPRSGLNDNATPWLGFSKRSSRKPWPAERSWRTWLRDTGIDRWRSDRTHSDQGGGA